MDNEAKVALKQAIQESLHLLGDQVGQFSEPYFVWRRLGDGGWHGEYERRPSLRQANAALGTQLEDIGANFADLFFRKHPEYADMVGFPQFGMIRLDGVGKSYIVGQATNYIWDRYGTFDCDEASVDTVVEEFEEFVDRPAVRFRFRAQLLNFHMTASRIAFPENLTIRRLSDQEVSAFHGGPVVVPGFRSARGPGIHEFAIEGEDEETKAFGESPTDTMSASNRIRARLDKAILCLRTFKAGRVGYEYINLEPVGFCPLAWPILTYGDLYVPFGRYEVSDDEARALSEHAKRIFRMSEPAMEMACSRLADAETRIRPQDQIVDAVIGMEALLLAGLGRDERRGELSYRFSLRYSTLFDSPESRYDAYLVARDLYNLRSIIAHGTSLKNDTVRVGGEKLGLADAAMRAMGALRLIMRRFLPESGAAPYKKPEFWDRALFGLLPATNSQDATTSGPEE